MQAHSVITSDGPLPESDFPSVHKYRREIKREKTLQEIDSIHSNSMRDIGRAWLGVGIFAVVVMILDLIGIGPAAKETLLISIGGAVVWTAFSLQITRSNTIERRIEMLQETLDSIENRIINPDV